MIVEVEHEGRTYELEFPDSMSEAQIAWQIRQNITGPRMPRPEELPPPEVPSLGSVLWKSVREALPWGEQSPGEKIGRFVRRAYERADAPPVPPSWAGTIAEWVLDPWNVVAGAGLGKLWRAFRAARQAGQARQAGAALQEFLEGQAKALAPADEPVEAFLRDQARGLVEAGEREAWAGVQRRVEQELSKGAPPPAALVPAATIAAAGQEPTPEEPAPVAAAGVGDAFRALGRLWRGEAKPSAVREAATVARTMEAERGVLVEALPIHKEVVQRAVDDIIRQGVTLEPFERVPLADQIMDLAERGVIRWTPALDTFWRESVRHSARTLQVLSAASQRLRGSVEFLGREIQRLEKLAPRDPAAQAQLETARQRYETVTQVLKARELDQPPPFSLGRAVENFRRGLMISQLSTAVRNAITQTGNLTGEMVNEALADGLRRLTGREPLRLSERLWEAAVHLAQTRDMAKEVLALFPRQEANLFSAWSGDVLREGARGPVGNLIVNGYGRAMEGVRALNVINTAQENAFRNIAFVARLDAEVARRGMGSLQALRDAGKLHVIPKEVVDEAVEYALRLTWAQMPKGELASRFVEFFSTPPMTLLIPYPRYTANALRWLVERSPLGPLRYLSRAEREALAQGDMRGLTQTLQGLMMLSGALAIRMSPLAGERWYEFRAPGNPNRVLDLRGFQPFAAYLMVAELALRGPESLSGQEALQGMFGWTSSASVGLRLVDDIINGLRGGPAGEPLGQKPLRETIARFGADYVASFLAPMRMVLDFADQMRAIATGSDLPVRVPRADPWGSVKAVVPGWRETLPVAWDPLTGGVELRKMPALRQLTGLILREKSPERAEADRLGIRWREIVPPSGDPQVDAKLAEYMGLEAPRRLAALLGSARYEWATDAEKAVMFTRALTEARDRARELFRRMEPDLWTRYEIRRTPTRERRVLEERGVLPEEVGRARRRLRETLR